MFNREKLVEVMKNKGVSMYRLWKLSGVSQSTISDMINKKGKNPTTKTLQRIADALDVSINDLFDENESENKGDFKPTLSVKEQEKLDKQAEELVDELTISLSQNKDHLSDRDYEVLRASLKGALQAMTLRNKEKYTPKKYKNKN